MSARCCKRSGTAAEKMDAPETSLADADGFALRAGHNCWRVEPANRVAVCVDGESYFGRLRESLIGAQHSIAIAAWDIHSRVDLVRPDPRDGWPTQLGDLLLRLLEVRPQLQVFILLWDYAPIYLLEREPLFFGEAPWGKEPGKGHPRLHFIKDGRHPALASQHQKLVVIDNALAYCGGLDLSKWRWDTNAHRADEPRRCDPDGEPYPPYHDVQMLVDGDAALALGELFADRWERAGGGPLRLSGRSPEQAERPPAPIPWPRGLATDFEAIGVGIARTLPAFEGQSEARESEQLYLDMIRTARHLLYIENQYLTSRCIAAALQESLAGVQGPEIVVVLPRETGHWLEQHTMDHMRSRLLRRLREADRHQRLHVVYPAVAGLDGACMMVHAKLMIADDRILRIGSSNLSNRSMGLDSECDLCILAEDASVQAAIRSLRQRLLAMLAGVDRDRFAPLERDLGVVAAIVQLQARDQRGGEAGARDGIVQLVPLPDDLDPEWDRQLPDERLIDPDRPLSPALVNDLVVGEAHTPYARWRSLSGIALLLLFVALAAVWRWTPAGDWLQPEAIAAVGQSLRDSPWGLPVALGAFVLASLAAVPVTLLILVTTLVFSPLSGALVSLVGASLSAVMGYGIGTLTGARMLESRFGERVADLRDRLRQRGILTVVTLRIVPVAPFAVLNLIAGAMRVRLRDFVLGTAIGMAPAVIAMALFSEGLLALLGDVNLRALALLVAAVLAIAGVVWLGRWIMQARG